jgi:hypothetical protein
MPKISNACGDRLHEPACTGYFDRMTGWTGYESDHCPCPCHDHETGTGPA